MMIIAYTHRSLAASSGDECFAHHEVNGWGKKRLVLRSSEPVYQDCWHTGLLCAIV